MRLKSVLKDIIEQYDQKGFTKSAALLIEASQAINQNNDKNNNGGLGFLSHLVMPSMGDFKKLANQGDKKRLLREIKSATIEKLTNKIIKSFAMEMAFITPFLLLIGL